MGDKQDVSNYRPISILTFFAKVFENYDKYYTIFLDRNDCLHENQFGFRKCYSTNHGIASVTPPITALQVLLHQSWHCKCYSTNHGIASVTPPIMALQVLLH